MSVSYDPDIIKNAAQALYDEARVIVRNTLIKYGFLSFLIGVGVCIFSNLNAKLGVGFVFGFGIIFLVIGAYIGRKAASTKAFELKLKAQTALCQVEIEKQSRGKGASSMEA